jgi:hypothetical protein
VQIAIISTTQITNFDVPVHGRAAHSTNWNAPVPLAPLDPKVRAT